MDNLLELHRQLVNKTYQHGDYHAFRINWSRKLNENHKFPLKKRQILARIDP
jgi:hypothetical protein